MRAVAGFTMTELMVVIAIVGFLMAVGVPSYRYVTNANRVSAEVNGLLGDLMLARSEAIKQGQSVSVCPSTDGANCVSTGTTWHGGWIVFNDANGNGTVDTGETVLRIQKAFTTTTDTFTSDNTAMTYVTFNREGFAVGQPTTTNNYVTIVLHTTPTNNQWTRCLQITTFGVLSTERYGQGSCQ